MQEKGYLHEKRWVKAEVAGETGPHHSLTERCFIKMFRPQHTEQLQKPGELQKTSLFSSSSFCTWLSRCWIPLCPPAVSPDGKLGPPDSSTLTNGHFILKVHLKSSINANPKSSSLHFNRGRESMSLTAVTSAARLPTLRGWWNKGGRSESTGRVMVLKGEEGQTGMEGRGSGWIQTF